jgi:hypothetical protein
MLAVPRHLLQRGGMTPRIIILFLSLLAPLAQCAVTVGWKIPVDRVAPELATNENVRKLAKPPGRSAFFQPGDELWDISAEVMGRASPEEPVPAKWPGEWLVWNARSGMIVARGTRGDIFFAQSVIGIEEQQRVVRTRFDLVRGTAEKVSSASLVTMSGEKASFDAAPLKIQVDPTLSSESDIIDEHVRVAWTEGSMEWEVSTYLTLHHGER